MVVFQSICLVKCWEEGSFYWSVLELIRLYWKVAFIFYSWLLYNIFCCMLSWATVVSLLFFLHNNHAIGTKNGRQQQTDHQKQISPELTNKRRQYVYFNSKFIKFLCFSWKKSGLSFTQINDVDDSCNNEAFSANNTFINYFCCLE